MNLIGFISLVLISQPVEAGSLVRLPEPHMRGGAPLAQNLSRRRSVREFTAQPLSIGQVGQLLWAAQGVTQRRWGLRTAPSAGALYPLETYLVLPSGIYHYAPHRHELRRVMAGDKRPELKKAALGQRAVAAAPAVFIFTAVYDRSAQKYGARATRYVHMEAGHACQNLLLQAVDLALAGVPIGAFHDHKVSRILGLPPSETPLYLVPVGYPVK